jgi:hypothetical protein
MKPPFLFDDEALARHLWGLTKSAPRRNQSQESKLFYGVCNRWNKMRSYGWITSDSPIDGVPDKELFCDASSLPKGIRELPKGARVEFVTRPSRTAGKPPEARVLRILDEAEAAA